MLSPHASATGRPPQSAILLLSLTLLPACTAIGSAMSPYSEKFSCKNSDHGQCIHPERAYADAVSGRTSKSDPKVSNGRKIAASNTAIASPRPKGTSGTPYLGYRDSIYQELKGLVEASVTPMLRPGRTIRTLILPYADRQRPDRLYMPRYIYSILDKPQWVVGDYLVTAHSPAQRVPVLEQSREKPSLVPESDIPAPPQEQEQ